MLYSLLLFVVVCFKLLRERERESASKASIEEPYVNVGL